MRGGSKSALLAVASVLVPVMALAPGGCANAPAMHDGDVASPEDGTIEIRVMSGADAPRDVLETRSLHAVIFPDGSLHFALSDRGNGRVLAERPQRERIGPDGLPPRVRILSRQEMGRLWSEAQSLGFLGDLTSSSSDDAHREVPRDGTIIEGQFIAGGRSWSVETTRDPSLGAALDPAITRFVRLVALLAWAMEEEEAAPIVAPRRYDLGPDPYAKYR